MIIPKLTCIDAGARNGLADLKAISKHLSVYSFEPGKGAAFENSGEFYEHTVIEKALYHSAGIFDFYNMRNPSMSSMLKPDQQVLDEYFYEIHDFKEWRKQLDIISQEKVDATSLDLICADHKIEIIDYLKLDTQGTELDILKGVEGLLRQKRILVIKTEFAFIPLYGGQPIFSEIDQYLKGFGYKLITCEFQYETTSPFTGGEKPKWGIGGDAFYCIDDPSDHKSMTRVAIVLAALGFNSNSMHYFLKSGTDKVVASDFLKSIKRVKKKDYLKYFLPPFVVSTLKKLR